MNRILHLSHTNIRCDSRILKELSAIASLPECHVSAIGVLDDEGSVDAERAGSLDIETLVLATKQLRWLHKVLRYPLVMAELLIRMTVLALRLRPTIVHSHDTMVLPIAALVSIVRGAKLVYDAHELESAKNGSTYLVSRAILAFEWICWPRVDLLISVSPSIIKWYQERFSEKRSVVVLNAPTLSEGTTGHTRGALPRSERTYFRQMYGIPEGRLIFIYVGYFGVGRGIERMLQVFSSGAVESHLVFMGYGDLREQIYCKTLESDNVHLHDPVPHERVVSVTQHADVGLCLIENVSLSDYYCLPNKLFEYAFAGVPVLASSFPDMSEVVDTYHLGSCTDPDVESITRAISEMEKAPPAPLTADFFPLSWEAQERVLREEYRRLLPEVGNDSAL